MMIPRLLKTKPILALAYATRMHAGKHMVMPTPTAAPCMAAIVGFEQWWIANEVRPPLDPVSDILSVGGLLAYPSLWSTSRSVFGFLIFPPSSFAPKKPI